MDRDRSEWTPTCPPNLRTDCKSSQVVYVGLQKVLASSKLGVADVLARLLGLLPADPEVLCFVVLRGICVAKRHHVRTVFRIRRIFFELVECPSFQDNPTVGA